jgi:hypothetical protein
MLTESRQAATGQNSALLMPYRPRRKVLSVSAAGLRNELKASIMAFAVGAFSDVKPSCGFVLRPHGSCGFLSGLALAGAGIFASGWLIATVATMQTMAVPFSAASESFVRAAPKIVAPAASQDRLIHVSKASRLMAFDAKPKAALTAEALRAHGERRAAATVATASLTLARTSRLAAEPAASPEVAVAAADPATASPAAVPAPQAHRSAKLTGDDLLAARAAPVNAGGGDRIIVPSKEAVAAAERSALLALAAPGPAATAPAPAQASGTPAEPQPAAQAAGPAASRPAGPVLAASKAPAAETQVAEADETPFSLVLAMPQEDVPLPMARPQRPAKAAAAGNASEPVLAYARPDDEDDEDDEMPAYKKPLRPVARAGIAVYDIANGVVYLPNGEQLEAHSGIGKMRDNPRYANQKMRGPTPPHTYNLRMRESRFHGVEAIRLTPVGGEAAIHGRNGLLAHTYMLGRNGDSNGCVVFKDYKRFLAAFKRGEIRQMVVVPRIDDRPGSTLASLFSSKG